MNAERESGRRVRDLEQRISVLEQVCAEAYQLAGAVGEPEKALDNLAAAAEGKPIPHATFLPVSAADCDEFALADARAARSARKAASPLRA
ncbi:MAG: hypothetical protein OXH69_02010 [Acidobacteria bacterium]|nr:hypothetical protein [Acidobacteriota bacterium]